MTETYDVNKICSRVQPGAFVFANHTGSDYTFPKAQNSVLFTFCGKISAILEITTEANSAKYPG